MYLNGIMTEYVVSLSGQMPRRIRRSSHVSSSQFMQAHTVTPAVSDATWLRPNDAKRTCSIGYVLRRSLRDYIGYDKYRRYAESAETRVSLWRSTLG